MRKKTPVIERFYRFVSPEPNTGCWLWTGAVGPNGYSRFQYGVEDTGYGHRLSYELFVGPIPTGHHVDHLCRVTVCVNPDHLEAVTPKENIRRSRKHFIPKTHCVNGHEFTPENTYPWRGERRCRTCRSNSSRRRHQKRNKND